MLQLSKTQTGVGPVFLYYFVVLFFENHLAILTILVDDQRFG